MSQTEAKISCKIAIAGAGKIGAGLARALVREQLIDSHNLIIIEKLSAARQAISKSLGAEVIEEPSELSAEAQVIILAVKPQDFAELSAKLNANLNPAALVISVMAGITMQSLQAQLSVKSLVRCMPNVALSIGQAMTTFVCSQATSAEQRALSAKILKSVGLVLEVDQESLLDGATAVAGSGPAYIFYIAEQMILAATKLGFSTDQAQLLVSQTILGSAQMLKAQPSEAQALKESVRSKGGTTHAALSVFDDKKLSEIILTAIRAAADRAKELAK